MCYTPTISFAAFSVEYIFGVKSLMIDHTNKIIKQISIIFFLLGGYQLSEVIICKTQFIHEAAAAGFAIVTFLPPAGLHLAYLIGGRTKTHPLVYFYYGLGLFFSTFGYWSPDFIDRVGCSKFFIYYTRGEGDILRPIYYFYYYLLLILGLTTLLYYMLKVKDKFVKTNALLTIIGYLSFMLPHFLYVVIVPIEGGTSPSVMCLFAFSLTIFLYAIVYRLNKKYSLDKKEQKKGFLKFF